jgi:hypothetical protein
MGFSTQRGNLPRLDSYEAALSYHNAQAPIRGRDSQHRPLRIDRKRVETAGVSQGAGGEILCRCHATDLVTYYPDGRLFITTRGWDTLTTKKFIYEVCGLHVSNYANGTQGIHLQGGVAMLPRNGITLRAHLTSVKWVLDNASDPAYRFTARVLNRKKANDIKKGLGGFLAWVAAQEALGASVWGGRHDPQMCLTTTLESASTVHYTPAWDALARTYSSVGSMWYGAYLLLGAVTEELLPAGATPKRNRWNQ